MTDIHTISPAIHPRNEVTNIPPGMGNDFPPISFECACW
jgi:hypothetical protein